MIEIASIFLSLISLLIFANFPLNFFLINKKFQIKVSYSESMLINVILNSNILLFTSFFLIDLKIIFIVYLLGSIYVFLNFFKNYIKMIKENFYLNLFFLIIFYSISLTIVKNAYLDWDGLAHWILKATVFFQGGEYKDLVGLPFDYYPHLGSYIWAYFWKNSLLQLEYSGRLFFVFIFLLSIFSLNNKFKKNFSNLEKILFIFIIIYLSTNFFLFGGYQEYFIFFIFFCFSNFFVLFFLDEKNQRSNIFPLILMLLISNAIMWVKQEGFFYYLILNLIFLVHAKSNLNKKIIFFVVAILLFYLFFYIKGSYFNSVEFNDTIINDETFKNLDIQYLFSKILIITKYFCITFLKYPIWLLISLSLVVLNYKYDYLKNNRFILTYLLLTFGLVYIIFLNSTDDISILIPLTLNRLVFALSGFLIFPCIDLINKLKEK